MHHFYSMQLISRDFWLLLSFVA
uniref:Uncharacterized protein n=1 Tax=Anguilla anguilla TaxID=7936 RepID=A0A0E9SFW6_ANGAN